MVIKKFPNPKGHQNAITGSTITAILLKRWIWPIGEASAGEGLRLQPAQQACFLITDDIVCIFVSENNNSIIIKKFEKNTRGSYLRKLMNI